MGTLRRSTLLLFVVICLGPSPAGATTALTVDLSSPLGPVTHAASGSLYGVLETKPADINGLVAPLHPNVFNNPASDVQQPVGDAIVVAGRVASTGARVSIRLADWFPGWPYGFTSMTDWFNKIGQTVSRRKAANLTNIYAYEIWNEPDGTWKSSNPLAFNEFWRQTYVQLRQLDPTIKIAGPSTSYYNQSFIQSLLSFCKTNDCLPDIVGWHELSGGNVTGDIQAYRALEKQLGIGPLPITINEYSGGADLTVEGQPGASAPLIAKFERFRVDSACISFWDVAHPGRLGSLLATDTSTNGGWWFYKWYGDMSGQMVATTPPNAASSTALDGFANLDATGGSASVVFGGVNDGTVQIAIKGFQAAPFLGSSVHVVVEHTPFVNRTTVVNATDVVSTSTLTVANDQVTVSVASTNNTDGYRVTLTPVGGGTGGGGGKGMGGTGGLANAGGASGAGGGAGGSPGSGGAGAGGRTGAAGAPGDGGHGGTEGVGGRPGSGGASAGASGTGGRGEGGGPGSGGTEAAGGAAGGGGSASPGGAGDSSGCACGIQDLSTGAGWPHGLSALALLAFLRRTARRRRVAERAPADKTESTDQPPWRQPT
ncbi:MAG TPA: hypothetical protein VHG72_20020 [Polyangia bacterium]|nr:hypothetical protein [Polyangia bacterium]